MALTDGQTAYVRGELGDDADLVDIEARLARTGQLNLAVIEVVRERLANLRSSPTILQVPGLSANNVANLRSLDEQLQRLAGEAGLTGAGGSGVLRRTQLQPRYARR